MKSKSVRVGAALLADGHKVGPNGKVDAVGLFNRFFIWGLPATREFSVVARIDEVSSGQHDFEVVLKASGRAVRTIANLNLDALVDTQSLTTGLRVAVEFKAEGVSKLGIRLVSEKGARTYWIPLSVEMMDWPKMPKGQALKSVLASPDTVKRVRAEIKCKSCSGEYVFEIALDPNAVPAADVEQFPEDGEFECRKCGEMHYLRDVEGQMRHHLSHQLEKGRK